MLWTVLTAHAQGQIPEWIHPKVAMEIVGHGGIEVIMSVCAHINLETQRRALNGLDPALSSHPEDVRPRCQRGLKIVDNALVHRRAG